MCKTYAGMVNSAGGGEEGDGGGDGVMEVREVMVEVRGDGRWMM